MRIGVLSIIPLLMSCSGGKELTVSVGSKAPDLSIVTPLDGAEYDEYDLIEFVGRTTDLEDAEVDLDVLWISSLDGELHTGHPDEQGALYFAIADLSPGDHAITLSVTDTSGLTGNTSIALTVIDQEDAPILELRSPADGNSEEGLMEIYQVSVSDVQDDPVDLMVTFSSDLDGDFCTPTPDNLGIASCEFALSVGIHQLTFYVEDSHGYSASENMEMIVMPSVDVDNDFDGFTENEGDCDDAVPTTNPNGVEVHNGVDDDCDGMIDEETEAYDDDLDGFTELQGDCDDADFEIFPSAIEECDGVDEDCDGVIDNDTPCFDDDGDGYSEDQGDCNDGNPNINPIAIEVFNGVDENCNGTIDENTQGYDDDGDGYTELAGDCDDGDNGIYPNATETCDSVDQDCNGIIDNDTICYDDDGDGYTEEDGDCADYQPAAFPGNTEIADGVDNNCDGDIDEGTVNFDDDGDCYCESSPCYGSITANCSTLSAGDCNDMSSVIHPNATETCDSIDEDCDGIADNNPINPLTWYLDNDQDLRGNPASSVMACNQPVGYVSNSNDCNDNEPLAWTSAPETCDQVDNDCDGSVDENVTNTYFPDNDSDGYGAVNQSVEACTVPAGYVANTGDCNDSCNSCYPGAVEACDGVDNNCDGSTDEINAIGCVDYYQDLDGDGYGNSNSFCQCGPTGSYDTTQSGDCYDNGQNDYLAYPGQTTYPTSPRGDSSWDYNCDGVVTKQWTGAESCSENWTGSATGCTKGWVSGEATCGQYKQYSTGCHLDCNWIGYCSCEYDNRSYRTQGCR